jgi:DNA-binding response OmpR family regulator
MALKTIELIMQKVVIYNAIIIDGNSNLGDYMRLMRYVKHRADRRRIAIITLIDKTSLAIRLRHNMNGSDLLLLKPIEMDKLCAALRKFIPKEQHVAASNYS